MSLSPLSVRLAEAFSERDVSVFSWDSEGEPSAVRITVQTTEECDRALALLQGTPSSFVVFEGQRYAPGGDVRPYSPVTLASADELYLEYGVEYIGPDMLGRAQVYIFAHTPQQWCDAQQVVRTLVEQGQISRLSYIEYDQDPVQGLSAAKLDAQPDCAWVVESIREAAYQKQNGLNEREDLLCEDEDFYEVEEKDFYEAEDREGAIENNEDDEEDIYFSQEEEAYADVTSSGELRAAIQHSILFPRRTAFSRHPCYTFLQQITASCMAWLRQVSLCRKKLPLQ